ncbi:hypothetical protein ANCCEY_14263 [Ancylostoma ceylanicum]|uniref:Integrase catalytic domain-containing protein n=1 Tax=Ancylostoma ceylanicum TaxID=53326 RepID=A0A0D6LA84_9BILA|nr:hypothetical protein ANCCEY_14263 [Ancylostoma ceylanicum]
MNEFQRHVPRMVAEQDQKYTLITYTDASSLAMAACTYLANESHSHLLMAKSKVPDIKRQTTIPKLELNALTIGTRLCLNVVLSLKSSVHINNVFIFTVSEIVLKWIAAPVHRNNNLGVFITNRVKEVHKVARNIEALNVPVQFGYINTTKNPADCATRGLIQRDLEAHIWWAGYNLDQIKNVEIIRNLVSIPEEEGEDHPSEAHLNMSHTSDEEKSQTSWISMHTMIAQKLLIIEAHGLYHNGTAHTMSQIRQMYWIPKLREQVKKHVRTCIPCQKSNNLAYRYPEITDLPKIRVTKAQPFQHIGLDYFGPLTTCEQTQSLVDRAMSNECIEWHHITPYSPWKGGFYERLIKTVKGSMFKSIGRRILTMDQLFTLLTEVEACLNTRPLTHQEAELEDSLHSIRPIDFIQKDMIIYLPLNNFEEDPNDPSYHPPSEAIQLNTRLQAQKALQSSCALTERYWRIWKNSYLTALREHHRRNMNNQRGCKRQPTLGEIVLITDSCQKRHQWRLGRIKYLVHSTDGNIREAEVFVGKNDTIRRPINQLIPLEIAGSEHKSQEHVTKNSEEAESQKQVKENTTPAQSRYNLRPRTARQSHFTSDAASPAPRLLRTMSSPCLQLLITVMTVAVAASASNSTDNVDALRHIIECRSQGVYLHSPEAQAYELCVNSFCVKEQGPPINQIVNLKVERSPRNLEHMQYTTKCDLAVHQTKLPMFQKTTDHAFEKTTGGIGPEQLSQLSHRCMPNCEYFFPPRQTLCQRVKSDQVQCRIKHCVNESNQTRCNVEMATIVKVNPFKKDACIRLQNNQSTVLEIEFHWDGLRLLCERTTLMHTRNVIQKVVDSKRCPHMGSCVRNKCSDINSTSLLPELAIGNRYPGRTACIESCGGPGCDCFYMSSGCLFYRIYGVPSDNAICELFQCSTWQEEVKAKVHVRRPAEKLLSYVIDLRPNIPVQLPSMEVTLSMLSFPPMNILNTKFITDIMKNTTTMWTSNTLPHLQCPSELSARNMQCNLHDSCECTPAESQVTCKCQNQDVRESLKKIENVLQVTLPFVKFSRHPTHTVMAQIDKDVSAEVIVNIKETVDTTIVDVTDEVCNIEDTLIYGCYRCVKGATATVSCSTLNTNISAEIDCGVDTFTVPCSPQTTMSSLQFLLPNARVQLNCSVKCGTSTKKRKAEERKLIDELRYKRSCIRLAPTPPTEEQVQRKIKQFLKLIINITRTNTLADECTEICGQRLTFFAKKEGTLYKCKMQNLYMKTQYTKEKIPGALQGLVMAVEAYGLLIMAKDASEKSRQDFYHQKVEGVSLGPAFVNEYTRKKLEFLDGLLKRAEAEIYEADLHIANEDHDSAYDQIMKALAESNKAVQGLSENVKSELQQYAQKLDSLGSSMDIVQRKINELEAAMSSFMEVPSKKTTMERKVPEEVLHPEQRLSDGEIDGESGEVIEEAEIKLLESEVYVTDIREATAKMKHVKGRHTMRSRPANVKAESEKKEAEYCDV